MSVFTDTAGVLHDLQKDPRLIPQQATNFESRLDLMTRLITPTDLFFVRANGPLLVEIDPAAWRLRVHGLVERDISLSLADLKAMPLRTVTAFLECSGNSRNRFPADPAPVEGTNWGNGAVGNAIWGGVSLTGVLDLAGVDSTAVDLIAQGGDFEGMRRGLPISVARDPDVLLAWQMNGDDLPAVHGGPVRLIVPGWGAIASTKWLIGLELIDHRFDGYWNADNYLLYDESGAATGPVTLMPVKSLIATPVTGDRISAGPQIIAGYAWSGHGGIARVEISIDGGESWREARIVAEAGPHSWVRFEHDWDPAPGEARLQSRATDAAGNIQPQHALWNAKGYQMNAIYQVVVTVDGSGVPGTGNPRPKT
jgi:DMSO/TMAO reductase YedYZ molybdopterin-dependent catalytic subunit